MGVGKIEKKERKFLTAYFHIVAGAFSRHYTRHADPDKVQEIGLKFHEAGNAAWAQDAEKVNERIDGLRATLQEITGQPQFKRALEKLDELQTKVYRVYGPEFKAGLGDYQQRIFQIMP